MPQRNTNEHKEKNGEVEPGAACALPLEPRVAQPSSVRESLIYAQWRQDAATTRRRGRLRHEGSKMRPVKPQRDADVGKWGAGVVLRCQGWPERDSRD